MIAGFVIAVSKRMRRRIDRPGDVPDIDRPHDHAPYHQAKAELQTANPLVCRRPTDERSARRRVIGAVAVIGFINLHFFHVLVDELYRHCALADSRSDAFDRAGPHVPRGEHAPPAGFEQEGVAGDVPVG